MQSITIIGLDIAKSVFQVHGVDAGGQVVVRRQLKRRYVLAFFQKLTPCLVGMEACASPHHWSRELQALGHTVRLIPPAYVKPYVKRQKNEFDEATGPASDDRAQKSPGRCRGFCLSIATSAQYLAGAPPS
jgi:transposase